MALTQTAKHRFVWWVLFIGALSPALYYWGLFVWSPRSLGIDALEVVLGEMGRWALWLLLITLSCSTLKRRAGVNQSIRYRRMLGLFVFFYASLHLGTYVIGWIELDTGQLVDDLLRRPFIYLGMIAWLCLLALAVTSPKAMVRKLKRNWARLHKLVYLILLLALIHFWMQVRVSSLEAWVYTLFAVVLMGDRLLAGKKMAPSPRGRGLG
ncbi:MAG: protein-methionine-sulfoxide reductase heme-binding subunit MsrQ [Saccharospirillum sp.]